MDMRKIRNKKGKTILVRSDPEFVKEMRELAKLRYFKELEKKQPTDAEMTRLVRRTNSWKTLINELKIKPRRENLI